MSLCNNQMGDFTVSQSRRFTETMGVGHEAIKTENKAWIPGAPEVVCQQGSKLTLAPSPEASGNHGG